MSPTILILFQGGLCVLKRDSYVVPQISGLFASNVSRLWRVPSVHVEVRQHLHLEYLACALPSKPCCLMDGTYPCKHIYGTALLQLVSVQKAKALHDIVCIDTCQAAPPHLSSSASASPSKRCLLAARASTRPYSCSGRPARFTSSLPVRVSARMASGLCTFQSQFCRDEQIYVNILLQADEQPAAVFACL